MRKKYKYAELCVNDKKEPIFLVKASFLDRERVIRINDLEDLLNSYSRKEERLEEEKKRTESLTTRVSKLRDELKIAKERQSDSKAIKDVCKIIQERIDFTSGEPVMEHVSQHMANVKRDLQKAGLWRE